MPSIRRIAIIGSGAAGLMGAIPASKAKDCVLITDGPIGRSNSMMAQGGRQLPFPSEESAGRFLDDILGSARTELGRGRNFGSHICMRADSGTQSRRGRRWSLHFESLSRSLGYREKNQCCR